MQFPIPPPTPQTSGNYNKVEKRRAVRASRREEVGEIFVFCFLFLFFFWALLVSLVLFFRQGVTAAVCLCPKCT